MNDKSSSKPHRSFGFMDFLWRWIAALILVFATYNPAGKSYFHWAKNAFSGDGLQALHYFVGVILIACWTIFIIATERSLGALGSIISTVAWLALFALGTLLAIGLSWSHIWRRISGQLEVDVD
jgi:hypothetical protein